uniref:Uncharacterized protein n=1 Tax=Caenorhabditis japonica TaxID=281687 RepID=A0A8R1EBM2_CAEJA
MTSSPIHENIIPVPIDTSETLIKLQAVSLKQGGTIKQNENKTKLNLPTEMGDKTLAPDNLLVAVIARLKKMLHEKRAINADWRAQQDRLAEKPEKLVEKVVRPAPDTTPICAAFNNMVKALVSEIKMATTSATKSKESAETLAKEVEKLALIVEQQQQKIQQLADVVRNCSLSNQRNSRTDDNLPHKRAKLDKGVNTYLKSCYICRKDHSAEECTHGVLKSTS